LLQRLETLDITERLEAEALVHEIGVARQALDRPETVGICEQDAAYMLKRIGQVEPLIQQAIRDWDYVESISL
jgi:hypothetical protein